MVISERIESGTVTIIFSGAEVLYMYLDHSVSWRSENNPWEFVLSSHFIRPGYQTDCQVWAEAPIPAEPYHQSWNGFISCSPPLWGFGKGLMEYIVYVVHNWNQYLWLSSTFVAEDDS